MSHQEARALIVEGKGVHCDPDVVDAFLDAELEFCRIAEKYADHDQSGTFGITGVLPNGFWLGEQPNSRL